MILSPIGVALAAGVLAATVGTTAYVAADGGNAAAPAPVVGSCSARPTATINNGVLTYTQVDPTCRFTVPQATTTATVPGPTATATVTETVPGPTQTVTQTVTATPTSPPPTEPTTPTSPPTTEPTTPAGDWCTPENVFINWEGRHYDFTDTSATVRQTNSWGAGGMGDYYADAGMWNVNNYNVTQHTLYCSDAHSFYVVNTSDNSARDGAVKTYPNIHMDTQYIPAGSKAWDQYNTVRATFEHRSPGQQGIYDVSFDVWFNGLGIELMVWTENYKQTPSGSKVGTIDYAGTTWDVWATGSHGYIALVPINGGIVTSGDWDLKTLFTGLNGMNLLPTTAVMTQLDYGVEVVSTDGIPARWDFRNITYTVQ